MRRLIAVLAVMLPWTAAAVAQPAPRVRPSRDVVVTYQVDGQALDLVPGGIQGPVTLSWDAAGQRVRAEAAGRTQVALLDLRGQTAQMFDSGLRMALPLPIKPQNLQMLSLDGARLTPTRRETVAGLSCNGYSFESAQGPGTVCLTPDGVPLSGQGTVNGKPGKFVATAVRYGAVPADQFVVPPGYMSLGGGGGSRGGLGGLAEKLGGSGIDLRGLLGHGK